MSSMSSAASSQISQRPRAAAAVPMIGGGQLAVLLCVCRLPPLLLSLSGSGETGVWTVFFAELFRMLFCLPLCLAFRMGWDPAGQRGAVIGVARLTGGIYLLVSAASLAAGAGVFISSTLYPGSSAFFFGAAILLLAAYGAHMGLEAAARAALPVLVLFGVLFLLTAAGVREEIRLFHLAPASDFGSILSDAFRRALWLPEGMVLLAAGPRSGGRKSGAVLWAFGLSAVFGVLASFLCGSVLGELQGQKAYPFFELEALMQLSIFQRMDAWFLALWVLVIFVRSLFLLWAAAELLGSLGRQPKRRRFLLPCLAAAAILLMALSLGGDIPGSLLKGVAESVFWLPALAVLLLAAAIFSRKGRRPR